MMIEPRPWSLRAKPHANSAEFNLPRSINTASLRMRRLLLFFVCLFLILASLLTLNIRYSLVRYEFLYNERMPSNIGLLLVAAAVLAVAQSIMGHLAQCVSIRRVIRA